MNHLVSGKLVILNLRQNSNNIKINSKVLLVKSMNKYQYDFDSFTKYIYYIRIKSQYISIFTKLMNFRHQSTNQVNISLKVRARQTVIIAISVILMIIVIQILGNIMIKGNSDSPQNHYLKSLRIQQRTRLLETLEEQQNHENIEQDNEESKTEQEKFEQLMQKLKPHRASYLKFKNPEIYTDTFKISTSKQLPFCLVIPEVKSSLEFQEILDSIKAQQYANYHISYEADQQFEDDSDDIRMKNTDIQDQNANQIYTIKVLVDLGCQPDSIVMPIRQQLRGNVLKQINMLYQRQNIWLTYEAPKSKEYTSISTFYKKVLDQLPMEKINTNEVKSYSFQLELQKFAFSLVHLANGHLQAFPVSLIYRQTPYKEGIGFFYGIINLTLKPYNNKVMIYLQPNHQNPVAVSDYFKKLSSYRPFPEQYKPQHSIQLSMMLKARQYIGLKDLPKNHLLFDREIFEYQQKYKLTQFQKQIPLCVISITRNNVEFNRYRNVLKSIEMQDYDNYHMVLIDDASTDQTFELSQSYISKSKLSQKTKMIHNKRRMYASYNIHQAVSNYCQPKQVVVMVDGDDELLGTQVFKLVNRAYQEQDAWVVYFSSISSTFKYGVSSNPEPSLFDIDEPRQQAQVFGPLRTFYADLYNRIGANAYRDKNGAFLDKLSDLAIQFPLFEMSGYEHIRYIPEVVYLYNQDDQGNDSWDQDDIKDKKKHLREILIKKKQKPINTLFDH